MGWTWAEKHQPPGAPGLNPCGGDAHQSPGVQGLYRLGGEGTWHPPR